MKYVLLVLNSAAHTRILVASMCGAKIRIKMENS